MSDSQQPNTPRRARKQSDANKESDARKSRQPQGQARQSPKTGDAGPAVDHTPSPGDPGHARAREVSAARNTAKSGGSGAAAPGDAHGRPDQSPGGARDQGDAERLRRRARFLRERSEARELRDRVQPRRTRTARMRQAMRMRTFRW